MGSNDSSEQALNDITTTPNTSQIKRTWAAGQDSSKKQIKYSKGSEVAPKRKGKRMKTQTQSKTNSIIEVNNDELSEKNKNNDTSIEEGIEDLLKEPLLALSKEQREVVANWYDNEQRRSNISITTCTGMKFQDVTIGSGRLAQKNDVVTFRYIGYLGKLHGSIFDKGLLSIRFGCKEIIPGLEEGIATMRSKGKRLIIIPPYLAYGESGNEKIPPSSTLAFLVDIVRIGSKKKNLEDKQQMRESNMPLPNTFLRKDKKKRGKT